MTIANTINLVDAVTRVSFHLFDIDREDLCDGILDVLEPAIPGPMAETPGPRGAEGYDRFIRRIYAIDLAAATGVVIEALVLKGSGLAPCILDAVKSTLSCRVQ